MKLHQKLESLRLIVSIFVFIGINTPRESAIAWNIKNRKALTLRNAHIGYQENLENVKHFN